MNAHPSSPGREALHLLDREPPAGYLREWTERIAAARTEREPGTRSVLIFRVGAEWLGLPTGIFQEVGEQRLMHTLPHRRGGPVAGLANIRGELLVCVSLSHLLGLAELANGKGDAGGRLLVANRNGDRVVFPVSEVCGVHRYHPRELRAVPSTLAQATATYTLGLLPWQDRTVGCLDDELLFYAFNQSLS